MSTTNVINERKEALLAYKEKILQEIKCCDQNIEEFRDNHKNNNYFDSSDSEDDWLPNVNMGPKTLELKSQQTRLRTCLQATLELTGLTVLQSEVNMIVDDSNVENEPPVREPGVWREVTAECRVDLVPFSITFCQHTPHRKFGASSYRSLRVMLVKTSHDVELNHSVLHTLTRPSDAVEVLRSYAEAYRSRRTSLARLANKYATSLFMEPHAEGGFVLKCADLMEVWWRLENKWSPVAPFHHKMKFDLEYMDESYIKIITQCHKQLSDPSIQTDERTLLLSKIISTCLEARGPIEPQEGVESDLESKTTDNDLKRDSEVMAPPKSLPKKVKTKSTAQKRSINDENNDKAKKKRVDSELKDAGDAKVSQRDDTDQAKDADVRMVKTKNVASTKNDNNITETMNDGNTKSKKSIPAGKTLATSDKNDGKTTSDGTRAAAEGNTKYKIDKSKKSVATLMQMPTAENKGNAGNSEGPKDGNTVNKIDKTKKNVIATKKSNANPKVSDTNDKDSNTKNVKTNKAQKSKPLTNPAESKKVPENNDANVKKTVINSKSKNVTKNSQQPNDGVIAPEGNINNMDLIVNGKHKDNHIGKAKDVPKSANANTVVSTNADTTNKDKTKVKSATNTKKAVDNKKIISDTGKNVTDKTKNAGTNKIVNAKSKSITNLNIDSTKPKNTADNMNPKKVLGKNEVKNDPQALKQSTEKFTNGRNKEKISDINVPIQKSTKSHTSDEQMNKNIQNDNKLPKTARNSLLKSRNFLRTGNIVAANKVFKPSNTEKENEGKVSKIPQKKLTPVSERSVKVNPLRISPRTMPSLFKSKQIMKTTTSIPRLLNKPNTKR